MKKIKIKKTCYVYLFICLVLRISFICIVFSLGLVLLVWLSKFHEWATCISVYNPLKFPETESKHLWLLCHFLFYSRFCISAPTQVTLAAVYFLKRGLGLLFSFILIILFYHYFPFKFDAFKTSKNIIEKFCKNYSTNKSMSLNWVNFLIEWNLGYAFNKEKGGNKRKTCFQPDCEEYLNTCRSVAWPFWQVRTRVHIVLKPSHKITCLLSFNT